MKPIARQGIFVEELVDEVLVLDTERDRAHCLNRTAAIVWRNCDGTRTLQDLGDLVHESYPELSRRMAGAIAASAVERLGRALLLEDSAPFAVSESDRLERREALRKLAIAPIVLSLMLPSAAMAASCAAIGDICSVQACCPGKTCCSAGSPCGTICKATAPQCTAC